MKFRIYNAMEDKIEKYNIYFTYGVRTLGYIVTTAIIELEGNSVAIGLACCSPKDRFEKAIGRKIALSRMLKIGAKAKQLWWAADKNIRKVFWKEYFKYINRGDIVKIINKNN